jgi:hypothetical protein
VNTIWHHPNNFGITCSIGRILSCSFVQFCSPLTRNTFQQVKSTDYFV